jgi:Flp pilus assembly protein TadD
VLAGVPLPQLPEKERVPFGAALAEFRGAQRAASDTAAAHLNLAVVNARRGRPDEAEAEYRVALSLEPDFLPARMNLANLYNAAGRNAEAEEQLRAALDTSLSRPPPTTPDEEVAFAQERGEVHYSLGLLLAEAGRLDAAEPELARAVDLMPERSRVRYNYGLILQQRGQRDAAEAVFLDAARRAPQDPDLANALAILYVQGGRFAEAREQAERAVVLTRGSPDARRLLQQIEAAIATGVAPGP